MTVRRLLRRMLPARVQGGLLRIRELIRVDHAVRRWVYDRFYDGTVVVRRGLRFRLHMSDHLSRCLFVEGEYGGNVRRVLQQVAPCFQTFVDCGANIGAITIPVSREFAGHAIAIEPVTKNFRLLAENLELNALGSRVHALQVALGDQPGSQVIYLSVSNSGDHRIAPPVGEDRPREQVRVETLDAVVFGDTAACPPFLVKVDVQGYECKLLTGAHSVLAEACCVVCEFWPAGLRAAGSDPEEFEQLLVRHGLHLYKLPKGRFRLEPVGRLADEAALLSGGAFRDIVATNLDLRELGLFRFIERVR